MLNESLFKKRLIIIGSIKTAKEIIPIIPEVFLIKSRLELTVLKVSFTEEPTNGTKLLIANRAVLIETESALCDRVLLKDNTNIKIDITNTVTDENVFFTVFDIPPKSKPCPTLLIQAKERHILISGNIKAIKKPSTKLIISSIVPLITAALDIFPLIDKREIIIGIKAFITPHRIFKYSDVNMVIRWHIEKTAIDTHSVEQSERALPDKALQELVSALKILIIISKARMAPKFLSTESIPESKYETVSSNRLFSLISPFMRLS